MSIIRQLARVANRIDSASTGTFLSKGDSTGDFTLVNYTDLSGRPTTLDSAALTSIVDSAYIQLRQTSAGSGGLDSAGITAIVDSNYVVARSPAASSGFANYEYTATAGQTTFQDSDINGNVMSYTADGIFVFYNGVMIAPTTDYTASDGSSVVLTTGADSGSHVAISKWNIASAGSSGSSVTWYGDRGVIGGGADNSASRETAMRYISIATPGNTTAFGDLTVGRFRLTSVSGGGVGVFAGGLGSANVDVMDYITTATTANATDFGDLINATKDPAGCSNGTRGVIAEGNQNTREVLQYITIASPGNATDFGDLTVGRYGSGAAADATYGVFSGGNEVTTNANSNIIDYITIATPSNATDFGDSTISGYFKCSGSDDTRGVFGGATVSGASNVIDYVTIATPGNATDFGDLTLAVYAYGSAAVDGTYWVNHGGFTGTTRTNIMSYVTIQTPSNATDFGDLSKELNGTTAVSGSSS